MKKCHFCDKKCHFLTNAVDCVTGKHPFWVILWDFNKEMEGKPSEAPGFSSGLQLILQSKKETSVPLI